MSTFTVKHGRSAYFYVQNSTSERYPYGICGPFATDAEAEDALGRISGCFPEADLHLEHGFFASDACAMLATDNAEARRRLDNLRA